jgi:hypothetical protein
MDTKYNSLTIHPFIPPGSSVVNNKIHLKNYEAEKFVFKVLEQSE